MSTNRPCSIPIISNVHIQPHSRHWRKSRLIVSFGEALQINASVVEPTLQRIPFPLWEGSGPHPMTNGDGWSFWLTAHLLRLSFRGCQCARGLRRRWTFITSFNDTIIGVIRPFLWDVLRVDIYCQVNVQCMLQIALN